VRKYYFYSFILLIAFIEIYFLALQSPVCGMDEVGYNDPAVNLYLNGTFTSTTWGMNNDKFWAMNVPLYQFVLFVWLKIFGFSGIKIHFFHTFLSLLNVSLLLTLLRKTMAELSPMWMYLFAFVFFTSGPYVYLTLSARPDNLAITFVLVILLILNNPANVFCSFKLFLFSAFLFATSIPGAIVLFSYLALFHWDLRKLFFIGAGFLFSGVVVFLIWRENEVVADFLVSANYNRSESLKSSFKEVVFQFFGEISFLSFLFLSFLFNLRVKYGWLNILRMFILTLVVYFLVKLNPYYVSLFILFIILESAQNSQFVQVLKKKSIWIHLFIICFATLNAYQIYGRLVVLERNFKNRNYSAFDYKFSKLINKTDVVFCEHPAYYSIKSRCNRVYTIQTLDLMNERELALVNKLVINPRRSKLRLSKKFDFAQWEMKSQSYCDLESGGFPNEDYNLVVYTRKIVL
jgi:hypothetical protein